jgi:putative endonuclease
MPYTYILFSPSSNSFYIGATTVEVDLRLEKHLREHYGRAYTASIKDWEVFLQIYCESTHQALMIEKHIKKMKSSNYIKNLKNYPEIIDKLKEKYNRE